MKLDLAYKSQFLGAAAALAIVSATLITVPIGERAAKADPLRTDLASICTANAVALAVAGIRPAVTIKQIPNGPQLPGGVQLVAATGKNPAYCQVSGSYVTNPATGKTANFLATFPSNWNGKYLQLGCSGSCGYLLMNNPAAPPITITAQGYPGQLIQKGYATFGNDLGHVALSPASMDPSWMKDANGDLNVDAMEDYLYRADLVMADLGKAMTKSFYGALSGEPREISRSYFSGCSQGGREALIAASQFPEKFDGIIAGSPAMNVSGVLWQWTGRAMLSESLAPAKLTPGQIRMVQDRVVAQCDAVDGVKDGLVQNPAACNFRPERDLSICAPGTSSDSCVSLAQAKLISMNVSALTDGAGNVLQPGYTVTDRDFGYVRPAPGGASIGDAPLRAMLGNAFAGQTLASGREGGSGGINGFHLVVNAAAYRAYSEVYRRGTIVRNDFADLVKHDRKLLWYANLSDDQLTPYMSINAYNAAAASHGGFAKLQRNIRFFGLPGTGHCGMSGPGPTNFDAIGALEDWVEHGRPPQALLARANDPARTNVLGGLVDWSIAPVRTMPLCTFPQEARYKGKGNINVAANWECRAGDTRMLNLGQSGREAGALR